MNQLWWTSLILIGVLNLRTIAFAEDHSAHVGGSPPSTKNEVKEDPRTPIDVPAEQQSRMGIKLAAAEKKPIKQTIRTVGNVTADQTKEAHVHTRINGWVDQIYADYVGKPVKKGQPLFELYSPDLVSTQEEYLVARKQGGAGREIAKAALERLKLWDVPQSEVDRLVKSGKSKRSVTFTSSVGGYIISKNAIRGMYITPEMELYHIADLAEVWVIATLYEYDISTIAVGDEANVQLSYDSAKTFSGKINYIYPEVDVETRTAKARIVIPNPKQILKPGMFTNVEIKKDLGEAVVVPDDSVIDTGTRKVVFVKSGPTRFEPREVKVGPRTDGSFAVLSGLNTGEQVVTSAHFLIDSESKFQAALQKGESMGGGHGGHTGKS
ncbi:efflux RND transporter periplasmic adaptor subunit [Bdellovibrionota bacterium FG-2]